MNMIHNFAAVSDGGMSMRTAAAVGGGTAGGFILFLSLLALCCCWSRHYSRPKHPPVHMNNDRSAAEVCGGDLIPNVKDETINTNYSYI